jgi:hypothetical protein
MNSRGTSRFQSSCRTPKLETLHSAEHGVQTQTYVLKLLLSLGLGYMRWTQLTPMLLMWGFALLMLLALTFVNFQQQTLFALESLLEWLTQLPLVGTRMASLLSGESTGMHLNTGDFESLVLSTWAVMSLALMLVGMVISWLFGPFRPWTLKRKIVLAAAGMVLLLAGLVANYYAAPHNFNGAASAWMLNFALISLLGFGVSAYSLSIAHFLAYLNDHLMASQANHSGRPGDLG